MWLIEVLYKLKRDLILLGSIGSRKVAYKKSEGPKSRDKNVTSLEISLGKGRALWLTEVLHKRKRISLGSVEYRKDIYKK